MYGRRFRLSDRFPQGIRRLSVCSHTLAFSRPSSRPHRDERAALCVCLKKIKSYVFAQRRCARQNFENNDFCGRRRLQVQGVLAVPAAWALRISLRTPGAKAPLPDDRGPASCTGGFEEAGKGALGISQDLHRLSFCFLRFPFYRPSLCKICSFLNFKQTLFRRAQMKKI